MASYSTPPNFIEDWRRLKARIAELERRMTGRALVQIAEQIARRQHAEALAEVSTASASYVDLGGPSVALTVPEGAFVAVFCQVDTRTDNAEGGVINVGLYEPTDLAAPRSLIGTALNTYTTQQSGTGRTIIVPTPGERTYSLRYRCTAASTTAFFRNRRLWAEVI